MADPNAPLEPVPGTRVMEWEGFWYTGTGKRLFHLPRSKTLQHFIDTGNQAMLDEAWLIPGVTINPTAIFQGLQRVGQEEALCFCGRPDGSLAAQYGARIAIPENKLFLVFMTIQFEITKWRMCEPCPNNPGLPINHATRFGTRLWPTD